MTDLSLREQIAKTVYAGMQWACANNCGDKAPEWPEGGNSFAQDEARKQADAILELLKGAVKPLEWRIAHDHWAAGSPYGLYSVGDAGGGYAFVSIPCEGGVTTMRVYPFDMGKPVAEALAARASILAALGVK